MDPILIISGITIAIVIAGFAALFVQNSKRDVSDPHLKAELERRQEEIGQLKDQLQSLKSKNDELTGNGKAMYDRHKTLESDHKALAKERDLLSERIAKFEAGKAQQDKGHDDKLAKLESAQKALEDERLRIRREDDERQQEIEAERDRMWAEHENNVIALLTSICKQPQTNFSTYTNDNLPDGFHGTFKPDFMIEFLNQYVIFDAKVSKSSNLQNYIADQIKRTAKKAKGNEAVYPTIFLVVPTDVIQELKTLQAYEEGFTFYIISPEAIQPVLASLKRIETYEFAEQMDPLERENIIDIIAHLDHHIATRNAVDWHLMQHGIDTLDKIRKADPDLIEEVLQKKTKIRHLSNNQAEQKEMVADPEILRDKLNQLTKPKPSIATDDLKQIK